MEHDANWLPAPLGFEELKKVNEHGVEYWSARELQPYLGYSQWRRFENAIEKAMISCNQSHNNPNHHFAGAGNPIISGKERTQVVEDYHLSRFACYLIAQNGDPRKPEIAQAQKYFAIQTRRQELSDAMIADAGYKGLYGGLGVDAIKFRKGIDSKEQLMDRMGTTELAANLFRMTQAREKLKRESVKNQREAIEAHETVGKEVRAAISKIGGTLPENLIPAEHIKLEKYQGP